MNYKLSVWKRKLYLSQAPLPGIGEGCARKFAMNGYRLILQRTECRETGSRKA